jgi:outer membrane protein TolC
MEEQAFYAEATAQLARARQVSVTVREGLTRLMGLSGAEANYRLPDRLLDLPSGVSAYPEIQKAALDERLDVVAARQDAASLAQSLGLVKTTRFINALEVGRARTKEGHEPFAYGWEFAIEIPLFDFGTARVARAEALYMQAVSRVAETAVNAESEVREAYAAYRTAYDTARHYRGEIVPLRKKISEEKLLRYNGMLISVFELLADAREQVAAVTASINASREFWLAETDLRSALTGAGVGPRIAGRVSPLPVGRQGAAPH